MKITTTYLRQVIKEELKKILNEVDFYDSPDEDKPGKNNYVSFSEKETYDLEGKTHGQLSHAIKHYGEFEPAKLQAALSAALNKAKESDNFTLKNADTNEVISTGDEAKSQANQNSMLNTFDLINDKIKNGLSITPEEQEIKTLIEPINNEYEQLVNSYMSGAEDIDGISDPSKIKSMFDAGKIIKFSGDFKGSPIKYYLNTSNSGLVAQAADGKLATLFRIDKKGNNIAKMAKYLTRGVEIKNPAFKELLSGSQAAPQQQQQKKEKQPKQQQQQSQNPVDFAKQLSARGLPVEKIKSIIMKKFNKNDAAASGIIKGAKLS
jgi:uncharacterized protein YeeX (DUF496 family)